jgi:hypothetical protein
MDSAIFEGFDGLIFAALERRDNIAEIRHALNA